MDKIVFDNPWLKVKQSPNGYIFSERKGKDSVAVLLYRQKYDLTSEDVTTFYEDLTLDNCEFLVRHQPLPVLNAQEKGAELPLFQCPITGSIDFDTDKNVAVTLFETVINEAKEEAGYGIRDQVIEPCGYYYAGTQTNETVYMFLVNVTDLSPEKVKGDGSYFESVSHNEWETFETVVDVKYSGLVILLQKLKEKLNGNK